MGLENDNTKLMENAGLNMKKCPNEPEPHESMME